MQLQCFEITNRSKSYRFVGDLCKKQNTLAKKGECKIVVVKKETKIVKTWKKEQETENKRKSTQNGETRSLFQVTEYGLN